MDSSAQAHTRALVLLNARSGTGCGPERGEEIAGLFARSGMEAEVVLARADEDFRSAIDRARAAGTRLVVAGGGDGTQAAVASHLAGTDGRAGRAAARHPEPFRQGPRHPAGTGRRGPHHRRRPRAGGGRGRGERPDLHQQLQPRPLPEIVRERERQRMRLGKGKWRALASASLHATQRPHGIAVRIESEDGAQARRTPFVFVGNNRYTMEGFGIGERESLQGGELVLYMAGGAAGWRWSSWRCAPCSSGWTRPGISRS
jgi:hypothetical protein